MANTLINLLTGDILQTQPLSRTETPTTPTTPAAETSKCYAGFKKADGVRLIYIKWKNQISFLEVRYNE